MPFWPIADVPFLADVEGLFDRRAWSVQNP
jgi:hypothetical protein